MAQPDGRLKAALDYLDSHLAQFQDQLVALSRIPGVSAEPAPAPALRRSAEAMAGVMREAGVENVEILEIEGVHPYVYGDWLKKPGAPTILLYGHHDVQPEGRPEKWLSPPYEPVVRNGRLFGRGTADDKAGCMTHIAAVASYLKSGGRAAGERALRDRGRGGDRLGEPRPLPEDVPRPARRRLHRALGHRELRHRHPGAHLPAARHLHRRPRGAVPRAPGPQRHVGRPGARPGAGRLPDHRGPLGQGRAARRAGALRAGGEDGQDPARAHPQAALQRGQVQARGRADEGHEAHRREGLLGVREALDAARRSP